MAAETAPETPRVTLDDIEAAAERIKGRVRRTPCLRSRFTLAPLHDGPLLLKLECLQVTGSFKARGANNAVLGLDRAALGRGIITASGGNHGIAVAYAGHASGARTVIYLSENVPAAKADRLRAWGAEVVVEGALWDDANEAAMARAERDGLRYIHPFADPAVIAGQGTVGREVLKQSPGIDVLVVAIGGGGLISGVATAAKAMAPGIRVVGVEPVGAPTLSAALAAGAVTTLDTIETDAVTLARQCALAFGFQELVLQWAASRKTLNAKSHGRLPRALAVDWRTFATLERELLRDLTPHYVENQKTRLPASPAEYLESLAQEGGST